jgi:hypothetical protein
MDLFSDIGYVQTRPVYMRLVRIQSGRGFLKKATEDCIEHRCFGTLDAVICQNILLDTCLLARWAAFSARPSLLYN